MTERKKIPIYSGAWRALANLQKEIEGEHKV